jgi:hypothetical protein
MRPMVTIIGDSLAWYGKDEQGGRHVFLSAIL